MKQRKIQIMFIGILSFLLILIIPLTILNQPHFGIIGSTIIIILITVLAFIYIVYIYEPRRDK